MNKQLEQPRDLRANHRIESLVLACAGCEHQEIELSSFCRLFHHHLRPSDSFLMMAMRISAVHR
jgi:hypothetical protein